MLIDSTPDQQELLTALAAAQLELGNAERTAKNSHTRSEYTTLAAALDAVRPVFASHGLSITQWPVMDGQTVAVVTRLGHKSGQWLQSVASAQPDQQRNKVQAVGSTITYLRRYALMAVAGIAPADDDGNAAGGRPSKKEAPDERRARQGGHDRSWEREKARFFAILGEIGVDYEHLCTFLAERKRNRPSQMGSDERHKLLGWLKDGGADKVRA